MEAQVVANPAGAPIVPGTGGIRAICYHRADPAAVCLPMACATADRDDMTPADRKGRSRLAAEIKRGEAK